MMIRVKWLSMLAISVLASPLSAADRKAVQLTLPEKLTHPCIACTPEELARLRAAYRAEGAAHDVVAARIEAADAALAEPIMFPPRGGQHNQWYQCGACQMGLKTIDPTHHKCPKCGKVYSGHPYDDVLFRRTHHRNLNNALAAAWAYALTGEAKYAGYARDVLTGYGRRYLKYELHNPWLASSDNAQKRGGHINPQTLGEGHSLAMTIAPAYDLIGGWPGLTDEDRATIERGLIAPMIKQISGNTAGKSNWQSWHNAGLFAAAVLIGDEETARRTIDDPANGFRFQMEASISEDGMWYENSWGYHFYTLGALVAHAESARRVGVDLWSHERFRKMFSLPLAYRMADGSLPRFGDAVQNSAMGTPRLTEAAHHAFGDEALLAMLPAKASWESVMYGRDVSRKAAPPAMGSRIIPGAGHAILRSDGPAGLTAAMTFGPYGGFHGHLDKLSFVFFGHGRELGVDPGRAASQAYRLPIHKHWYKATLGHNAVLVDQVSQQPAAGKLLAFVVGDGFVAAAAACDEAYEDISHRRLLCLTDTYLLVVDDLRSAAKNPATRRFDWVYHDRAATVTCAAAMDAGALGADYPGGEFLKDMKVGTTDETVRVVFSGPAGSTHLTAAGAAGAEVRVGTGPGSSVLDRVPLAMLTHRGTDAAFACVLEPTAGQAPPTAGDVALARRDGRLVVTVAGSAVVSWDGDDKIVFTSTP